MKNNSQLDRQKYEELKYIFQEVAHLRGVRRLLSWDQETYMPEKGQGNRAEQTAVISRLIHKKIIADSTGALIEELFEQVYPKDPENDQFVCLREWKRIYDKQKRLPQKLVEELSRQSVLAHKAWAEARKEADFSIFLPFFQNLVHLSREKARCLGYEKSPYDALVDEYEPGATTEETTHLFEGLVEPLKDLLSQLKGSTAAQGVKISGNFPLEQQRSLAQLAASLLGLDMEASRIDTVLHPFSTKIGPGDCRITTRWDRDDFTEAFFGVLHEAGHAIYSQNLPSHHYGTPLGESVSLGIHESQSRFWENVVGRSRPFWKYFLPIARGLFPGQLDQLDIDGFLKAINRVRPSFIRVEADEVTYNLHVYLRFKIERELIEGVIEPKDVPERWNGLFQDIFSIKVPDDAKGCLQDVHWSGASFGYFPTYTYGNIYSAMLFKAMKQEIPELGKQLETGNFLPIFDWLKEKIHIHGQRYWPKELIERATGKRPSPQPLVEYLREKYSHLYLASR